MRVVGSLLLAFHFLALLVYPLPKEDGAFGRLPAVFRVPLAAIVPPAAAAIDRLTDPYLRLFSLHQHWSFFAPDPLADTPVLIGTAFGRLPSDPDGAWRDQAVILPSALDPNASRLLRNRELYLLLKGSRADAHPAFGSAIARWVCTEAESAAGWRPEGVRLRVTRYPVIPPWVEGRGSDRAPAVPVVEDVGGLACPAP